MIMIIVKFENVLFETEARNPFLCMLESIIIKNVEHSTSHILHMLKKNVLRVLSLFHMQIMFS